MPVVNPGIRRFLGSAIQRLFNGASFSAPLTHSAIPTRAAPGTTGTFTRATTSTWPNNDGYMVTGVAGEIGFVGARRVRNLVTKSEDLTSGWSANNAGSVTATTITFTAANNDGWVITAFTPIVGNTYRWSALVSTVSGTKNIRFRAGGAALSADIPITTTPTRVSALFTSVTAGGNYGIYNESAGGAATINCTQMQLEDVTAQTTQTAGEYVSVGVESAPYYHGSFVDGVKCFPTDLSGNQIPSITLLGYQAQGARTNLCLQSQDFATTWVLGRVTCATNNTVAPDGTTTADTLTAASGTTISHFAFQSGIVPSATTQSYSIYAKAGTSNFICLNLQTAANNYVSKVFDLGNGVLGETSLGSSSGALVSSRITSVGNGWYRLNIVAQVTGASGLFSIFFANAATGNSFTTTGDVEITTAGTETLMVWGAQVELGSFASSYIATTTIAVTRNADVLTYSGGDVPNLKTLYAGFNYPAVVDASTNYTVVSVDDGGLTTNSSTMRVAGDTLKFQTLTFSGSALQSLQDHTNAINSANHKAALTWPANGIISVIDGGDAKTDASNTPPAGLTTLRIGLNSSGGQNLNGNVGGIYGWTRNLSQSELNAITA